MRTKKVGKRRSRRLPVLALAAMAFGVAAAAAQAKGPIPPVLPGGNDPTATDGGNTADQTVGAVQAGPVTVDPGAVVADTPVAGAVAGTTAAIGESGGNHASGSGGVVQVGGGNSATGSAGVAQVSSSRSHTAVHVSTPNGGTADVIAPARITGSGSNQADDSAVVAQVGSGHSDGGSTGAARINPTTAGVAAAADVAGLVPGAVAGASLSADEVLGRTLGIDLASVGSIPAPAARALLRLAQLAEPGLPVATAIRRLIDTGVLVIGRNGDDIRIDLGSLTIQLISLERRPAAMVTVLGTTLTLGGSIGVPFTGVPTATDSLAAAQVGGGNTATNSLGTAQVGSLDVSPAAGLHNDLLGTTAVLGGSSGVQAGNNSSQGSIGVVQVGGVQVAPTLDVAIDGLGSLVLGGSIVGIPTGTNGATDSIGVVQVGGGNTSNGSIGAVQSGSPTVSPTVGGTVTPLETGTSLSPVITLGGSGTGPGNSATDSIGAVQVGTSNSATESIGTAQIGPTSVTGGPSGGTEGGGGGTSGGTEGGGTTGNQGGTTGGGPSTGGVGGESPQAGTAPTAGASPASPPSSAAGAPNAASNRASSPSTSQSAVLPKTAAGGTAPSGHTSLIGGRLPFTGIPLWIVALLALGLGVSGAALRRGAVAWRH
jgi:hypothetical protein